MRSLVLPEGGPWAPASPPPLPLFAPRVVRPLATAQMPAGGHRALSIAALAERLARFVEPAPGRAWDAPYWVPGGTLLAAEAQALGIAGETDLFGGVVAHPFMAGKAITHPLADTCQPHPEGWCPAFAEAVTAHALPGLSAFSPTAALEAGTRLLADGPVRLKTAWTDGGHGQASVDSVAALRREVDRLDAGLLARHGMVLERNLEEVVTFSVGRIHVGSRALAYVGTQSVTTDNAGRPAYGGSRLTAVRGDFSVLAASPLSPTLKWMLVHAQAYDMAADAHLPGFFASRRNYDVVLGRDGRGNVLSGVLESSWRAGGASGAEMAAMRAFAEDPELVRVVASCREIYGKDANPPKEADVYCATDDPEVGRLTKYARVETRCHA